jgi:hypothetical protein
LLQHVNKQKKRFFYCSFQGAGRKDERLCKTLTVDSKTQRRGVKSSGEGHKVEGLTEKHSVEA